MQITDMGFGHFGILFKKFYNHYASSLHLSNAMNSNSIVERIITVSLDDFHEMATPASVNA